MPQNTTIVPLYGHEKIEVKNGDYLLLVSLNKSYDQTQAKGVYKRKDLFNSTRMYWRISHEKAKKVNYVLGVYKGIVKCVIKISSHNWVNKAEDGTRFNKPRCCFEGVPCPDSTYLHKDVSDYPFGCGGSIRYISSAKSSP